ncbi:MAG: FAD-binding protein [Candidatus Kapabacteria bacterium]|nr:FAD-binding protein [Candidatus Kapabacteria bacterium]
MVLTPAEAADAAELRRHAMGQAGISPARADVNVKVVRRSIDARSRQPRIRIVADVFVGHEPPAERRVSDMLRQANPARRVIIVGAGPAGYFAALELLLHGITPVVLDRGKDVRARRRDLRAIQQDGVVDPHSNYCFGEGGAGTYSDGKLYTRSHKRGSIETVLQLLVEHGATSDILIDAHPHIGSNKLWQVVQNIRHTIENHGGEVHFGAHVTDLVITANGNGRRARGVVTSDGMEFVGDAVILATGHSARDVFALCARRGVEIEAKPFALGVRIEHPQELIDGIRYHQTPRDPNLPASSYSLVCQSDQRGVFSFCMCPGGLIVPAATAPGEIVVNGMSMSRRDSPFANSGTVVAVEPDDWKQSGYDGIFGALEFQAHTERSAFAANGTGSQKAPAQRLMDYLDGRVSTQIPKTSYIPGHVSADMSDVLPAAIDARLRNGIRQFGSMMPGYLTNEAVMVAVESRTSSPVRIPRHRETYEHVGVSRLYPCGEGAGYAGGIVSAALDGQNVARAIALTYAGS